MKVLVACEFSGVVRRAFRDLGHDAYSCDLLPAEDGETIWHFQDDIAKRIRWTYWDMLIAHPPCTRLTVAGARWFKGREQEQADAIAFCEALWAADIPRICIENPIGVLSTRSKLGKPTQIIQPWQFGHGETKATCLWLKGLPKLEPTNIVEGRVARVHREPPGPDRWKNRSRTYEGIAAAMALQWGGDIRKEQAA
jgi:site-specific DNA-cytosine methylase